jgi:hypothetical protein
MSAKTFDVYWSPEGRRIATVEATDNRAAIRKAPQPYRLYPGEMYAVNVIDSVAPCDVTPTCLRHKGGCSYVND